MEIETKSDNNNRISKKESFRSKLKYRLNVIDCLKKG